MLAVLCAAASIAAAALPARVRRWDPRPGCSTTSLPAGTGWGVSLECRDGFRCSSAVRARARGAGPGLDCVPAPLKPRECARERAGKRAGRQAGDVPPLPHLRRPAARRRARCAAARPSPEGWRPARLERRRRRRPPARQSRAGPPSPRPPTSSLAAPCPPPALATSPRTARWGRRAHRRRARNPGTAELEGWMKLLSCLCLCMYVCACVCVYMCGKGEMDSRRVGSQSASMAVCAVIRTPQNSKSTTDARVLGSRRQGRPPARADGPSAPHRRLGQQTRHAPRSGVESTRKTPRPASERVRSGGLPARGWVRLPNTPAAAPGATPLTLPARHRDLKQDTPIQLPGTCQAGTRKPLQLSPSPHM